MSVEMFQDEYNSKKTEDLDRLQEVLTFEEILEEMDLTEEEVLEILYDQGLVRLPPHLSNEFGYEDDKQDSFSEGSAL